MTEGTTPTSKYSALTPGNQRLVDLAVADYLKGQSPDEVRIGNLREQLAGEINVIKLRGIEFGGSRTSGHTGVNRF